MAETGHKYINIQHSSAEKHCSNLLEGRNALKITLKKKEIEVSADAHLAVPFPAGHPWSWARWSGCSPGSGGGPPASRWSPALGARRVWEARPSDSWSILRSLVPSTSPSPPAAQSPSPTPQLPRAERKRGTIPITIRSAWRELHKCNCIKVMDRLLLQQFYDYVWNSVVEQIIGCI